jgi:2-dehydro-3-deoxyphosphogluconate aldolase/(4S)-4-hydroxy-2-oxoglutarate aldolase
MTDDPAKAVMEAVAAQGVVAIVRTRTAEEGEELVGRLLAAGLRAVEVSLSTPDALGIIGRLAGRIPARAYLGVGTVLDAASCAAAAAVGARFVVTPALRRTVVEAATANKMAALPGVMTPTEALSALEWGASAVKLFPATTWTPAAVRDLQQALPNLPVVPTGGVGLDDAPAWIAAGALAVGLGGALTRALPEEIPARVEELLSRLAAVRDRTEGKGWAVGARASESPAGRG